jgi:predicted ATP-grasp superfamily ATP-dependent carboligase
VRSLGAVVVGGYVNGLGLVRALAARGIATAVVTTKPYDIAHRSRWVSAVDAAPGIEDRPELLVEVLERRAAEWQGWALFPTNDEALSSLAQHHERLSSRYRVVAPPWEVARALVDKDLMLEAAQAVGADPPRCYGAASEATAALPEMRFPVVVKPTIGYRFAARFGTKLFVADDREALRRSVAKLVDAGLEARVFDFVPGGDDRIYGYCTYVDDRGEPLGGLTVRKLRQGPPLFGVARAAEIASTDRALREVTVELLRHVDFRGMAVAEFKLDPRDGGFRFIEVNGRSVIYNALLRRAGLDLAALAWSDYVRGERGFVGATGWPGLWVNVHADLLYTAFHRGAGRVGLGDVLSSYRRPLIDAVWAADDPGPFLLQWARTARAGVSALWAGKLAEQLVDRARVPGKR